MKASKPRVFFPRLVAVNDKPSGAEVGPDGESYEEIPVGGAWYDKGRRATLTATFLILGGFAVLIAWMAFVPIHRGASAPGRVQQETARSVVQHMDGGIVDKILVKEGDFVQAGQLIATLDDRPATIALALLTQQHRLLLIEQAMLNAERTGQTSITWPAEVVAMQNDPATARAMQTNLTVLQSKAADRAAQKAVLNEEISRLGAHSVGIDAQKAALEEQARLIKVELEGVQSLYDRGLVPKTRLLSLQRSAADLQGSIGASVATVSQDKVQAGESRLRMLQVDTQMQQEDAKRLQEIQSNLFELGDRIDSQKLVLDRTKIHAPLTGIVLHRAVTSPGQVLRPADPVLDIIPNDKVIVSAMIRPTDVEKVKIGARAVVKLNGLNVQTTPRLYGKVIYISADLITDKDGKPTGYETKVEVPMIERRKLGNVVITPGMPAEIMVDAGARTALQYLLQPVTGAFGKAFRE
jgi:HlyD family type I secretion membrane fusion protein